MRYATNFLTKHSERLMTMIFFGCLFTVLGYFAPRIYLEFLDKRDYIEIKQPVSPEFSSYKRGEKIGLIINRRSFVNAAVSQQAKLVHVNGALVTRQLDDRYTSKQVAIENTNGEWVVVKTDGTRIPCDAMPGRSFIQVIFQYTVGGIPKNYNYITSVFEITKEQDPSCEVAK